MNHYRVLANSAGEQLSGLAILVLQHYSSSQIRILSGPRKGLVMLRMRETVADSNFNAGEILVTEVKLELDGQFGFGMVIGDNAQRAVAVALVDAALRKGGPLVAQLNTEIEKLSQQLHDEHRKLYQLVATSKVEFDLM